MAEIRALDDPCWGSATKGCLRCGYDFSGLAEGRLCPECGFALGADQFIVCGVPSSRSVMSRTRIAMIVLLSVIGMFLPQLLIVLGLTVSAWAALAGFGIFILIIVWVVISAPRTQGGSGRMIFTPGGLCLVPLKVTSDSTTDLTKSYIDLPRPVGVWVTPVSSVWAKLQIVSAHRDTLFRAGIRCPRERAVEVQQTLQTLLSRPIGAAPGPVVPPPAAVPQRARGSNVPDSP